MAAGNAIPAIAAQDDSLPAVRLSRALNIEDLRELARRRVPKIEILPMSRMRARMNDPHSMGDMVEVWDAARRQVAATQWAALHPQYSRRTAMPL